MKRNNSRIFIFPKSVPKRGWFYFDHNMEIAVIIVFFFLSLNNMFEQRYEETGSDRNLGASSPMSILIQ